jgi:tRNA A37 threonylcarbamoyladenosine modification protein TsaB
VVDAKKGEVFCAQYDGHGSRYSGYMNLSPGVLVGLVQDETLFTGNGCDLYRDVLMKSLGKLYHEAAIHLWSPRASVLAGIALDMQPEGSSARDILPIYVRASDATLLLERAGKR